MNIERYIGGGKVFYTPFTGGVYGTEREIGEIKDMKLNISTETKEAFSNDTAIGKKVDHVISRVTSKLSFSTQNISKENRAMFYLGALTTETFAVGDTLPDGTVAATEITYDVITGGQTPLVEGKFRFTGNTIRGKNPTLVTHAVVTPTGERGYITEDFAKLDFDGEILETAELGLFKEYTEQT